MHQKTKNICVFTQRASTPFRSVMKGIVYASHMRGWAVRTIELDTTAVGIRRLIAEWQPAGVLSYYLSPEQFPKKCACVHINPRNATGGWSIRHDSRETGIIAAEELAKLSGRSYAFVCAQTNAPWSQTRGRLFSETLAKLGHSCSFCDIPRTPNDPLSEQANLARWIEHLPLPCAIFAANDETAESVLGAALSAGLDVPGDVAILGADNDENRCENTAVTLSSVAPDFFRGGALGCELLEARMDNPGRAPRQATLYGDTGVVARSSTRLQLKHDSLVSQMCEFIRLRAIDGISATDVIGATGRQRRSVEIAFKKAIGKSIGREIQDSRLALAKLILADKSVQIGQIAGLVGYISQNHLERIFKRTFGMTMAEMRSSSRF